MMKLFFLMFLLIPLIEIYFLIEIGGMVGVGMTILLVVFTAVLGAFLVRAQGFATFVRLQTQRARGEPLALELLAGGLLFVAGALLLTPGFFTDAVGFVLLIPSLRRKIITSVMNRGMFGGMAGPAPTPAGRGRVIDADYEKID